MRDNASKKGIMTSRAALVAIGVVIALLVVVAVVFAIVPPPQFDPDTPEGTIQGYFQAVNDGDLSRATTYLTDELAATCDFDRWLPETGSVVIMDVSIDGDEAVVDVRISVSYGEGPFNGGSYDENERVVMERIGDRWLISKPLWPMDIYACSEAAQ
jgi:hypothetical protein